MSAEKRASMVEDVVIPKTLFNTAKFNAGWNLARWEQSLPEYGYDSSSVLSEKSTLFRSHSVKTAQPEKPARVARRRQKSDPLTVEEVRLAADAKNHLRDGHHEHIQRPFPLSPVAESPGFLPPRPPYLYHGPDVESGKSLRSVATTAKRMSKRISHGITNNVPFASNRRHSMHDIYERAKVRSVAIRRKYWVQLLFEYGVYLGLILFVYFVLIGMPLWKGAVWWLYWVVRTKFVLPGGYAIILGLATLYAFVPLLIVFEKDPQPEMTTKEADFDLEKNTSNTKATALLIPCYKSATIIGPTLDAALKIFPAENIFVVANGNSPTPLDETEDVCRTYGVNHIWVPIGSKITAQFVGCYALKGFESVLLIDDDCALPPTFPVVSDRLKDRVKCIGYTIQSVGANSSKGTFCQQAQDLEYKISGLQRAFAGKVGSATFPHGAISLWDLEFLKQTFHNHPGFSISEDWFFGDACRRLGGRIVMCSAVFVETETPSAVFFSSGGNRGGFGEMTIFKQRFSRWNFFFVNGIYYNMKYILTSWQLGWWEIGAKVFVFQEVYETLLYLLTPFVLPISFIVRPAFCGILLAITVGMYMLNVLIFNEVHLRRKNARVSWTVMLIYYTPYKIVLTFINVLSCYWSMYKYARYFATRHPKVIEDEHALEVVLRLEENLPDADDAEVTASGGLTRKLTLSKVQTKRQSYRSSILVSRDGSVGGDYFNAHNVI